MVQSLHDYCIEREEFELLKEWDKENNGELTPYDVTKGSHKKVWWRCGKGHKWQAVIYARTGQRSGCPYCTKRKHFPFADTLASEYPELVKEWHSTLNIGISPYEISSGSHRKVWWKCSKGHEWSAQIKSRTRGSKCPVCSNRKVMTGFNDLATTNPEITAQWHPFKNGTRTPQTVIGGQHVKVWWKCPKGHEWQADITSRTIGGKGCPACAGKIVVPGENDLKSMYPAIAAQWHSSKNGTLTPEQVTPFSNKKVWWVCEKGHEFYSVIAHRTHNSSGCPYCTNRKVLEGFNDLATIEPIIAKQWHKELNGDLTPKMVTVGSRKKVWWKCSEGHVWKAVIYSRAGSQKCGCPVCSGKVKGTKRLYYTDIVNNRMQAMR